MSDLSKNWMILFVLGCLSVLAGILALLNPFGATLAAELLAGWSFLVIGVAQIINAFREEEWGGRLWTILLGVVALLAGISLVMNPLAGIITLTVVLGVMFLVSGIFKLIVGFRVHDSALKWAVIISGIISILLGLMILSNFPGSAVVALGVMLAVELLSNGVTAIALAWSRKSGGVHAAA